MSLTVRSSRMFARGRSVVYVLGVMTLVLPWVSGATALAAAPVYREWSLSGVTFDDGGTLSGTLIIADDGTPENFDVTTSGGNTDVFGTVHYSGQPSPLSGNGANGWYVWAPGFGQYLNLLLPDTTAAHQGDSLPLSTQSWECTNCVAIRYVTAGTIVAGETVDLTPPDVTGAVDPGFPDGRHGWYSGSPTVSFTVNDPESAISDKTGCGDQTVDTDTRSIEFTCQATSQGGTNSASIFLRRDATPPVISPRITRKHVLLDSAAAVVPHAKDALSGLASQGCHAPTNVPGVAFASCHATDVAGNSAHIRLRYTVEYVLAHLIASGTADGKLHVRMQLRDVTGEVISNAAAAQLGCLVTLTMTGAQTHNGCMTYRPSTHRFRVSWTLGGRAGDAMVTATVRYPGSSVLTTTTTAFKIGQAQAATPFIAGR